jgi:hypothetical protein
MAKTRKVPKKIAGVKVPKTLRRGLRDLAKRREGRAVLAEALAAAGTALAAVRSGIGSAVTAGAEAAGEARAATVEALEDATRSFTESLRRREPEVPTPETTPPPSVATH